jgi:hypothetical protein
LSALYSGCVGADTAATTRDGAKAGLCDMSYAFDRNVAIAVLRVETDLFYLQTDWETDERLERCGTRIDVVVLNRSLKHGISGLETGRYTYMVDDLGRQYAAQEDRMYWEDDEENWHVHPQVLAPGATMEGFIIYPPMQHGAEGVRDWYWNGGASVGGEWRKIEIHIPLKW